MLAGFCILFSVSKDNHQYCSPAAVGKIIHNCFFRSAQVVGMFRKEQPGKVEFLDDVILLIEGPFYLFSKQLVNKVQEQMSCR